MSNNIIRWPEAFEKASVILKVMVAEHNQLANGL